MYSSIHDTRENSTCKVGKTDNPTTFTYITFITYASYESLKDRAGEHIVSRG